MGTALTAWSATAPRLVWILAAAPCGAAEEVYHEAIYDEHPELRHTLRTEFSVLLVGCVEGGAIRQHLPAQPPPLH